LRIDLNLTASLDNTDIDDPAGVIHNRITPHNSIHLNHDS